MTDVTNRALPLEILVIDDDEGVRETMEFLLPDCAEKIGVRVNVATASDGRTGLEEYRRSLDRAPYDVVFTDLKMPQVDGAEVTKQIKELRPETFVYVVTGLEKNQQYMQLRAELRQLAPDDVIEKPFSVATIKNYLQIVASRKYDIGTNPVNQTPPQS